MFEVGKLSDESMDTFLGELEKVSLLDAEGEGEVSRYFAHAVSIFCHRNELIMQKKYLKLELLPKVIKFIKFNDFFIGNFTLNNNCTKKYNRCRSRFTTVRMFRELRL